MGGRAGGKCKDTVKIIMECYCNKNNKKNCLQLCGLRRARPWPGTAPAPGPGPAWAGPGPGRVWARLGPCLDQAQSCSRPGHFLKICVSSWLGHHPNQTSSFFAGFDRENAQGLSPGSMNTADEPKQLPDRRIGDSLS